jgi:hypothetical protein
VRIRILHVSDCPNVAVLQQRLDDLLAGGQLDVQVVREVADSEDAAATAGMAGSPTLLVDGVDPFADGEPAPSVSCRLYRDESGRLDRAPSTAQLRRALQLEPHPSPPEQVDSRPPAATALLGRRARTAPLDPLDGRVHRMILRTFANTGSPPSRAELNRLAADPAAIDQVLARLHHADVLRLDPAGTPAVAYPFSAAPTRHRVQILGEAEVYAMCAIDALGISPMLGADTRISSTDPLTAQQVTVHTDDGDTSWRPDTAVVVVPARASEGPSADCCCSSINFYVNRRTALAWTTAHPDIDAEILHPTDAEQLARRIFGSLLRG